MKRKTCTLLFVLYFLLAYESMSQKEIKLLVRGDDMGYSHSGNEAILKCYKEGIQRSAEILVPSPWFPEAVKMLNENPGLDAGIHLCLTSEWDNVKWRPLTHCPSLTDANGYLLPKVRPDKYYPGQSILENDWKIEEIEKEFRAQIETAIRNVPHITHLSSHMGCTTLSNEVAALVDQLAKEYKLVQRSPKHKIQILSYGEASNTTIGLTDRLIHILDTLQPGNTYMLVEHPGLDDAELQAIHHKGYENVAAARQRVTDSWTDKRILEIIKKRNIKLISYADLR